MYIEILLIIVAYFLGSIPTSYLIGKYKYGFDIRQRGSGNVGGANAARTMGMKVGILSGLVDILKGTAATLIAIWYSSNYPAATGIFQDPNVLVAACSFMAVIGHCYSWILGFKGGKGGATTAGVVLALDWVTFLVLVGIWIIVVGSTRFTSLGNLVAVWVIPPMLKLREKVLYEKVASPIPSPAYQIMSFALVVLIYYRHRDNIGRLLQGNERKFGQRE
ncbi:MAG: glycerol-3-phosphate 1-O-acyltransferase [Methanobacteriota archaeon]|nr:MAG: glycerol-3-phosphate 1-O-acyltransferase [Euryarchaeota archaeon]